MRVATGIFIAFLLLSGPQVSSGALLLSGGTSPSRIETNLWNSASLEGLEKSVGAVGKRIEIFIVRERFLCHLFGLFPD